VIEDLFNVTDIRSEVYDQDFIVLMTKKIRLIGIALQYREVHRSINIVFITCNTTFTPE